MDSTLRQGSKGNAVIELQQLLQGQGFYSAKVDGDFGPGTLNAVIKFQKANGLTADGIVGNASWAKLRAVASPAPQSLPTLLAGSKGAAVSKAQQLLKDKGYYQGRIDGDFGPATGNAITAFQRANGLTVDGKIGAQTWDKLQQPAIADNSPPVTFVEIVREPASTPTTASTPPSIFVPTSTAPVSTPVTPFNPIPATPVTPPATNPSVTDKPITDTPVANTPVPTASAISLVDAANSYSRARLLNQTTAINNLQANIDPVILQQFLQRWQVASAQATTTTSLQEAFSGYNNTQKLNQNLALQWLQNQILPFAIDQFRQDWSNLNAGLTAPPTAPSTPPSQPTVTTPPQIQLINLTDAVKAYTRSPSQVTALEKLQAAIPEKTMQQFFQRWSVASEQNAIAISLLDVFQDYNSPKYPNQVIALQWLEKELNTADLEQFSRNWQS